MPARKRGGLTCPYLVQAICFVPDDHRARRLGGEPPEAVLVVPLLRRTTPRVPACRGEARPRKASGLWRFRSTRRARGGSLAGTGRPSWGPQRRRSARAGIDRCVRQPRSRVHSGDRLRAPTGREGGGQCVFQRRHRATHARGGYGAGPLPRLHDSAAGCPGYLPARNQLASAGLSSPRPAGTAVAIANGHPP